MTAFTSFLSTHSWILIVAAAWTLPWKGVALWKSARNGQTIWFVVFLVVNTLAILEIIYILFFSKRKNHELVLEKIEQESNNKRKYQTRRV